MRRSTNTPGAAHTNRPADVPCNPQSSGTIPPNETPAHNRGYDSSHRIDSALNGALSSLEHVMQQFSWVPPGEKQGSSKRTKQRMVKRLLNVHKVFYTCVIQRVCAAGQLDLGIFHRRSLAATHAEKSGMYTGKRLEQSLPISIVNRLRKVFACEQRKKVNLENRAAWVYWKDLSGIAYSQLQTLGEVLSNLRPGMRQVVATSNMMTSAANKFLLIRPTCAAGDGHQTSAIRLLQFILPGLFDHTPNAFQSDEVIFSVTGDGYEARGALGKRSYTSMMFGVLQEGAATLWQSPHWKFVVAEWAGADNRANIQKHCKQLFDDVKFLMSMDAGLPVYVNAKTGLQLRYIKPRVVFCSDLKFRWEVMGCGGAHDPHFCDACDIHRDQRRKVYTTYATKAGDTVQSIADMCDVPTTTVLEMNPPDAELQAALAPLTQGDQEVNACISESAQTSNASTSKDGGTMHTPQQCSLQHNVTITANNMPLPVGIVLRVWKVWHMNRDRAKALLPIPHIDCPFCWLHCFVRLTEHMMTAALERALMMEGSSAGLLNRNMERHKIAFRVAREQDAHGSKKGSDLGGGVKLAEYKAVKLTGVVAAALVENVVLYGSSSWLEGIDTRESTLRLWKLWWLLHVVGRKLQPNEDDIDFFARYSKEFHRLCVHVMPDYVCNAYYFHYLSAHGGQYIRQWKSLGKFMQEGVEGRHKISKANHLHTTGGGAGGTTRGSRNEDGSRDVVRVLHGKHPTLMQMERNCRMLLYRFFNYNHIDLQSCITWQDASNGGFVEADTTECAENAVELQGLLDNCKTTCAPRLAVSKERMGIKSICRYKACKHNTSHVMNEVLPEACHSVASTAACCIFDEVITQRLADACKESARNHRKKAPLHKAAAVPDEIQNAAKGLYHECQHLQFCFMHAFNMYMGFAALTRDALISYLQYREKKVPSIASAYDKQSGFFNSVSMNAYLQGKGVRMEHDAQSINLCYLKSIGHVHKGTTEDAFVRSMLNYDKVIITWTRDIAPTATPWNGVAHAAVLRRKQRSGYYFLQDSMLPGKVAFMGYDLKWEDLAGSLWVLQCGRMPKLAAVDLTADQAMPSSSNMEAGPSVLAPDQGQVTDVPPTTSEEPDQKENGKGKGKGSKRRPRDAAFQRKVRLDNTAPQTSQPAKRRKK